MHSLSMLKHALDSWALPDLMIKSISTTPNEEGDYPFEIEASNEEYDQEDDKILQKALEKRKSYFLKNGVISDNHGHYLDPKNKYDYVIGYPTDVKFNKSNGKTYVSGALYGNHDNPAVKKTVNSIIALVKSGCKTVRASIGAPKSTKKDGKVHDLAWNDLAITLYPINDRVHGLDHKSVLKALTVGSNPDSTTATGGEVFRVSSLGTEKIKDIISNSKTETKAKEALIKAGCSEIQADTILAKTKNKWYNKLNKEKQMNEDDEDELKSLLKAIDKEGISSEDFIKMSKKPEYKSALEKTGWSFRKGVTNDPEEDPDDDPDDPNDYDYDDDNVRDRAKGRVRKSYDDTVDVSSFIERLGEDLIDIKDQISALSADQSLVKSLIVNVAKKSLAAEPVMKALGSITTGTQAVMSSANKDSSIFKSMSDSEIHGVIRNAAETGKISREIRDEYVNAIFANGERSVKYDGIIKSLQGGAK